MSSTDTSQDVAAEAERRTPLTTELVVDAAAAIADAEGLDTLTLTRVADKLGTSQPALYRHIDGYEPLVRALGLRAREILAHRLSQSAVGLSRDDAVSAMAHAWRSLVVDHPGLYAATDRYPCAGDAELEVAVEQVVGVIQQGLRGYNLDIDQQVHAARTLRSLFHGFSHLEAGDGHPLDQDLDDSFERSIDLVCAGIKLINGSASTS